MWISQDDFQKKLEGCWMGKNIGGTLGQPYEGVQGTLDIDFYTQDLKGEPVPNDDLDLQLVWLVAAERFGHTLNASILGEYWISYIHPNWSEYGFCKTNMRKGIAPPLSGSVQNSHKNSNGAWIRSEIWACLTPGHPDLAARYAAEDASVDHCDEGVHSAVFCAALESAAFVEQDKYTLIDIALSYIPHQCGVARGIRNVIESYEQGLSWKEARRKLLLELPDNFGSRQEGELDTDIPKGEVGYDAPANVGLFILGWLYGEDDFGKSLCIAVNCGRDTDCTAATLGAVFGIIHGVDHIPERWKEPIGRAIKTCCLHGDLFTRFPASIDELTERIMKLVPRFINLRDIDFFTGANGYALQLKEGEQLYNKTPKRGPFHIEATYDDYQANHKPFALRYDTPLYNAWFDFNGEPFLNQNDIREVKLHFHNRLEFPLWLQFKWILPEGWQVSPATESSMMLSHHFYTGQSDVSFKITHGGETKPKYDLYLDIITEGRHTRLVIPVTFYTLLK